MKDTNNTRTEINEIGEFGLIKHLTSAFNTINPTTLYAVGDDAAVIDSSSGVTLVSTDLLIENVHFDLVYTPLRHLGYKAAIVNFSDIAAMNALPSQITVSIAVSNRISVEALEEIYAGIKLACDKYHVDLVGGDTTSSKSGLLISVTVIGIANEDDITYRNTAQQGDLICTSGNLGAAYMGLLLLEREKKVFQANPEMQPDFSGYDYVLQRQLKPEARVDVINLLKDLGVKPTAMIDISDGLASDILHICENSNVGCAIYEDKLPIDTQTSEACREFEIDSSIAALSGGEDYELLFTIAQEDYTKIKDNKMISIVGHITEKSAGYQFITRSGQVTALRAQGWDAFLNKGEEQ